MDASGGGQTRLQQRPHPLTNCLLRLIDVHQLTPTRSSGPGLLDSDAVELVAICDEDAEALREQQYKLKVAGYANADANRFASIVAERYGLGPGAVAA